MVRIVPHVDTGGAFIGISHDHKIDFLEVIDRRGPDADCDTLISEVQERFKFKAYVEWCRD